MGRLFWVLALSLVLATSFEAAGQVVVRRSSSTITLEGKRYYMHNVSARETLYAICKAYGVSEKSVEQRNPFIANGIRNGQLLFIPVDAPDAESASTPQVQSTPLATILPPVISTTNPEVLTPLVDDNVTAIPLGLTAPINGNAPLEVALMLPFGGGNDVTFIDFYRGAIIALDKLKESGLSVNVNILSTNSSANTVSDMIYNGKLDKANLIIGPVYDAPFDIAARYATMRQIPIISPLVPTSAAASPFIIEVAPSDANKWNKASSIITNVDANVVVVDYEGNNDSMVMAEIETIVPSTAQKLLYSGKATHINTITSVLSRDKMNVIVLPSSNENAVEGFLARLSSINSTARYKITVVGTSRWGRFNKIDFELFFKLGVVYPSSYHADRSNDKVSNFYNAYIKRFEDMPSLFSFRGYDVVNYFVSLIANHGNRSLLELSGYKSELLQMPYNFTQRNEYDKFRNSAWGLVIYKPNFSIIVE